MLKEFITMTKNEYKIMINEKSIMLLKQLNEILNLNIDLNRYKTTINKKENEKINFKDLPFEVLDLVIDKNKTKLQKNKLMNKILKSRLKGYFNYDSWRKENNLEKIDEKRFLTNLNYNNFSENKIFITEKEIINSVKNYKGVHFIENNLKNNEVKIIKTNEMLGYSACLEFPFTGESIIIFDEKLEYEEALYYFIHELSHSIFNKYKFLKNIVTPIEEDEKIAYSIQTEIILNVFPEYKKNYMCHIYNLYKTACLHYEFEKSLYNNPNDTFYKRSENNLNLLKKYNFNEKYYEDWINNENYFNNPFYNSSYVIPLENILNGKYKKNLKQLELIYHN